MSTRWNFAWWLTVATLVLAGVARPASAQTGEWLGLWCGRDVQIAVVNFGLDPATLPALVREQVPGASSLIPVRVHLVPPRPGGGCGIAGVGEVRVTSHAFFTRGGLGCTPSTRSVAWVGHRRVIDDRISPCHGYGLVITPSLVFECVLTIENAVHAYEKAKPEYEPICNPLGDPRLIGRPDGSMFASDGSPRPRAGLSLRYAENAGLCDSFIPVHGGFQPGYPRAFAEAPHDRLAFRGGIFTARPASSQSANGEPTQGIDWHWFDSAEGHRLGVAAVDFLNTGRLDAVLWVRNLFRGYDADGYEEYFVIMPGRGADLEAIEPKVARTWEERGNGWLKAGDANDGRFVWQLKSDFDIVVLHSDDVVPGRRFAEFRAIRHRKTTYTVASGWNGERYGDLHVVLSRIERDGRLTPVCMYDRTLPPPKAQW